MCIWSDWLFSWRENTACLTSFLLVGLLNATVALHCCSVAWQTAASFLFHACFLITFFCTWNEMDFEVLVTDTSLRSLFICIFFFFFLEISLSIAVIINCNCKWRTYVLSAVVSHFISQIEIVVWLGNYVWRSLERPSVEYDLRLFHASWRTCRFELCSWFGEPVTCTWGTR